MLNSGYEMPINSLETIVPHGDEFINIQGEMEKPETYSSGSLDLHMALAVSSMIVSSLSLNVSRMESTCRRKVVFSARLFENMY